MARGVKRKEPYYQTHGFTGPDPYPEHRKLNGHMETNWQIREFVFWLRSQSKADLAGLEFDEINDLILEFRGVDVLAYKAEVAHMRSRYRWLWDKAKPEQTEPIEMFRSSEPAQAAHSPVEVPEVPSVPEDPLQHLLSKVRGSRDVQ